jgi:hypothetical protein
MSAIGEQRTFLGNGRMSGMRPKADLQDGDVKVRS